MNNQEAIEILREKISPCVGGEWELELPRYCKITAWKPLPESYREDEE